MSNDLILTKNLALERIPVPIEIQAFADQARDYADRARAVRTRRSYASDIRAFLSWCNAHNACPLPANNATVLAYLIDGPGRLKVSTLRRRLVAIREHHAAAGHVMDTGSAAFKDTWHEIQRDRGRPTRKRPW